MPTALSMDEEVADAFSFDVPANFSPPDDYVEGKPFDAVVSMVLSNGRLMLKAINGAQLAEDETEEEVDEETEEELEETPTEDVEMTEEDGGSTLGSAIESLRT